MPAGIAVVLGRKAKKNKNKKKQKKQDFSNLLLSFQAIHGCNHQLYSGVRWLSGRVLDSSARAS